MQPLVNKTALLTSSGTDIAHACTAILAGQCAPGLAVGMIDHASGAMVADREIPTDA